MFSSTSSGLSRRKGSTNSRFRVGKFALLIVVVVGLAVSAAVVVLFKVQAQSSETATKSRLPRTPDQRAEAARANASLSLRKNAAHHHSAKKNRLKQQAEQESLETFSKDIQVVLVISMEDLGDIRINLLPQYSAESVQYILNVVETGECDRCNFYRAEAKGILQGIIKHKSIPIPKQKGSCPPESKSVANNCPPHDSSCGCHGPVMQRGYVGWAAGKTGPDFFIDDYRQPATHWGTQHTVWGQIVDKASLGVIDHIWSLPVRHSGLTYLQTPLQFTMEIEQIAKG